MARLDTVNRHADTLAQDGQSTSNGLRDSQAALRESWTQLDAKEKEIQELNGLNQTLRSENDELRRKLAAETQQSQQALRENSNNAATVHRLLMQQRKMAFKCLLPDDQGGVEEVRRNAKQLTGFSSAEAFVAMWHLLNHDGAAARMKTWTAKNSEELPDRKRKEHARPNAVAVPWEDVFFYWWFVVKTGVNHTVASFLFGIELSTATRKFVSMTSFQDEFWSAQFPKPSLEVIQATAPADFQHVYRTDAVVCIIDCKEIFTTTPSEPQAQRALWSDYKQHCTVKILSAITPAGAAVWCSDAYPGRITDTEIARVSGFVQWMNKGEAAAADRGFDQVSHLLAEKGSHICFPPKRLPGKKDAGTGKREAKPFTADEVKETSAQANLRIHIERAYAAACKFKYVAQELNLDAVDMVSRIFRVVFFCAVNFHKPLRSAAEDVENGSK